jgi:hypothetical protein
MATPDQADVGRSQRRVGRALERTRGFIRVVHRDPEHVTERMTLYAADRLGESSREWAAATLEKNPDTSRRNLADALREDSAKVARVDGAVAGTPFFIALVPGYVAYLWQEARMSLRTAALYGRDPTTLQTAAEMLALRGVHPTPEQAREALIATRDTELPPKPTKRRPLSVWVRSVRSILLFGGFLSPPSEEKPEEEPEEVAHPRWKAALGFGIAAAIWVATWVLPVTFMVAMAWNCESHARQLGRRVRDFYNGEAATTEEAVEEADEEEDRGHTRREIVRSALLFLSVAIPVAFVAVADHYRQSTGINWLGALGALVALSLVLATAVVASRR